MRVLIVVDVQNDFIPGGALAVPGGHEVVDIINALMGRYDVVILTQDWHPEGHLSFASQHEGKAPFDVVRFPYGPQVLWHDHCVQGTLGAEFHPDLRTDKAHAVVRKGYRREIDSYSGLFENDKRTPTGLDGLLRSLLNTRFGSTDMVDVCGLALDFCVSYTALDIKAHVPNVHVRILEHASRAIDLNGSLDQARGLWEEAGVEVVGMAEAA